MFSSCCLLLLGLQLHLPCFFMVSFGVIRSFSSNSDISGPYCVNFTWVGKAKTEVFPRHMTLRKESTVSGTALNNCMRHHDYNLSFCSRMRILCMFSEVVGENTIAQNLWWWEHLLSTPEYDGCFPWMELLSLYLNEVTLPTLKCTQLL